MVKNLSKKHYRRRFYRVKRHRSNGGFKIPIAPIAGILAMPAVGYAIDYAKTGNISGITKAMGYVVGFGDDKKFHFDILQANMTPLLMGFAVHKLAAMIGLNRMLGGAKVPLVRV